MGMNVKGKHRSMKQFIKIAALLLALAMLLSLTVLPAFADDETDDVVTLTSTDEDGDPTEIDMNGLEFTDDTEGEAADKTDDAVDGADGEVTTTGTEETSEDLAASTETEEKKGLSTNAIIWIVVGGVVLVAAVVLCIVFREKVGKFFRVYKSEVKKIVWLPWDQTKKSTLVVLVILLISAAAICLIDLGLSKGFLAFLKLFQ